MIGMGDEKAGTRDAERGTRETPFASGELVSILSLDVGFAHNLPQFLTFARHVPRTAFQVF